MRAEVPVGLCLLMFASASALAADPLPGAADEFDFFDYLGEMVEEEGEWLDPLAMETDLQLDGANVAAADERDAVAPGVPQGEDDE